jgi:hypothetical protein
VFWIKKTPRIKAPRRIKSDLGNPTTLAQCDRACGLPTTWKPAYRFFSASLQHVADRISTVRALLYARLNRILREAMTLRFMGQGNTEFLLSLFPKEFK